MSYAATTIPGTSVTRPGTTAPTVTKARRAGLLGGIGGLVFAGTVLAQNTIRSDFPANDVSAGEVMSYYADHRGATIALAALMPLGVLSLTTFLGTVIGRLVGGAGRAAAIAGAFGAAAVIATFTMVTASDVAIAGYIHRGAADVTVVDGMWVMHNAIFGLLMAALAAALVGLTQASRLSGLLSRRWSVAGLIGGALLLTGAMTTPAMIDGGPTLFVGVAGFIVWIAFVIRTSVALIRNEEVR
jgi:hypothetical protein